MMSKTLSILVVACVAAFALPALTQAQEADCVLSIRSQDISVVPAAPFLDQTARIYATVSPDCNRDAEGSVLFTANDALIGNKPISYKQDGRAEEVWVNWRPSEYGETTIRVETKGGNSEGGDSASISIFIDRDSDGDGVGDREDADDDNDGVPDGQDSHPTDPTRTQDSDRDGQDDTVDSDDDNDGVYDFQEEEQGTDPKAYDTDRDGVSDKHDDYPLDPKRSKTPTPKVEAATESVAEESAITPPPSNIPEAPGIVLGEEDEPKGEARVLNNRLENGVATSELPEGMDAQNETPSDKVGLMDWVHGFGLWFLLALGFLSLGTFFFWQDKRSRQKEESEG